MAHEMSNVIVNSLAQVGAMEQGATVHEVFELGRSFGAWLDRPVDRRLLVQAYELAAKGPTSMNCQPMRVQFLSSERAKAPLLPCLAAANVEKARTAPVVAVIGYDLAFHEWLPKVFPHRPEARNGYIANPLLAQETALRNGTLQGAYLMVCLRAAGLDCGPMSGFDAAAVDAALWAGTTVRTNFLCNIGWGDRSKLFGRQPRLAFEEACSFDA